MAQRYSVWRRSSGRMPVREIWSRHVLLVRRCARSRPMSIRAVLAVWSIALVAAGGGVAFILASDRSWPATSIALSAVIGLTFVGSGLLARVRRPENRTGVLLMLVGFSWFGGALGASDQSLPFTLGYANGVLIAAFFVHLVRGVIRPRVSR